jgi:hypothetical protein
VGDENSREELEELLTLRAVRKEDPGESGCLLRDERNAWNNYSVHPLRLLLNSRN